MPRTIRVRRNWNKRNGFKLATTAKEVSTGMTGNTNFPKPPVTMPEMDTEIVNLFNNYSNRKNGTKAKYEYEMSLETIGKIMTAQANYVDEISAGKKAIIESSGFTATSDTNTKKPVPAVPGLPTVKNENGALSLSIDAIEYATSYFWIVFIGESFPISISGNQMWGEKAGNFIMIPAGTSREYVRGLASGTPVTVQVLAQNSTGKSDFTLPVSTYAAHS